MAAAQEDLQGAKSLAVYIEPAGPLEPATNVYSPRVGRPAGGPGNPRTPGPGASPPRRPPGVQAVEFSLDLRAEPVHWHGRFFSGICNVIFCTQAANYGPTYDLMAEARKQHPHAWSYQRDFWLTGTEFRPAAFLPRNLPNIVRERETRRIAAIEPRQGSVVLRVEDVFGHEQYGIPAGRPVGEDYHPGDEVLIADGIHDARTKVLAADRAAGTVTVAAVRDARPAAGRSPTTDRSRSERIPTRPGLFAPGGCYLRKFTRTARRAITGAGSTRSGTSPTAIRPPRRGQLRRRARRPRARRPELDHRQGLRPVARGRPARSPATSSTAMAPTRSTLPGASSTSPTWGRCSGGPTGTSFRRSTTTRPTRSCGRSRIGDTTRTRSSSADWSWAGSSART